MAEKIKFNTASVLKEFVSPIQGIKGLKSFRDSFKNSSNLTGSIPGNLFKNATQVTEFKNTFWNSSIGGNIPPYLFKYNTMATSFEGVFRGAYNLTGAVPSELFEYNLSASSFAYAFSGAAAISYVPSDIFVNNSPTALDYALKA